MEQKRYLSLSFPPSLSLFFSPSLLTSKGKDEKRTREWEEKKRKAEERAFLFFSFSFLGSCVLPTAAGRALLSPLFFFSLIHCETPQLGCRSRVSCPLQSPQIRQLDNVQRPIQRKIIILDAASCRCGRGEKGKKEDALLRVSIFWPLRRKHRAVSNPPKACCPLKTFLVAQNDSCLSTASKIRDQNPRPLPPGPRKRRHMASGSTASHSPPFQTIFSLPRFQTEKTKRSPALSSQSRAGRAPRAAGAPLLWIAWRMVRRKAQRVERGEKTKRTKKVWRRCSKLFNLLFRNSLLPSLFLRLSLPSSSFLGFFPRRPSERAVVAQRASLAALRFLSPSSPLFPLVHPPNSFPLFACVCKTD